MATQHPSTKCTLCGTGTTAAPARTLRGEWPLCRQCHAGGMEHHGGDEDAVYSSINTMARRNGYLPLEERAHPRDLHTPKDAPLFNDRRRR